MKWKQSALCLSVFILIVLHSSCASRIPPPWLSISERLCVTFDDQHPTPAVINNMCYLQSLEENLRYPIMYLFPPVILWSPLEQFKNALAAPVMCPKRTLASQGNVALVPTGWRNGAHGEGSEPRKVYGVDGMTFLVG